LLWSLFRRWKDKENERHEYSKYISEKTQVDLGQFNHILRVKYPSKRKTNPNDYCPKIQSFGHWFKLSYGLLLQEA